MKNEKNLRSLFLKCSKFPFFVSIRNEFLVVFYFVLSSLATCGYKSVNKVLRWINYFIVVPLKHHLTCAVNQVPTGCYGADAAAHGCIHLVRSAHNRSCHWIPDDGRLDSSYPEILLYYYYNRRYLSCCSNNNTLCHN